jgi:hypothetical protein
MSKRNQGKSQKNLEDNGGGVSGGSHQRAGRAGTYQIVDPIVPDPNGNRAQRRAAARQRNNDDE